MKLLAPLILFLSLQALAAETAIVNMKSLSFEPKTLQITQGQAVIWKNVALTDHTATAENSPPSFDTGLIHPKHESEKITFNKVGEFKYHCSIHGKTMSGVILVKAAQP